MTLKVHSPPGYPGKLLFAICLMALILGFSSLAVADPPNTNTKGTGSQTLANANDGSTGGTQTPLVSPADFKFEIKNPFLQQAATAPKTNPGKQAATEYKYDTVFAAMQPPTAVDMLAVAHYSAVQPPTLGASFHPTDNPVRQNALMIDTAYIMKNATTDHISVAGGLRNITVDISSA